MLIRKLNKLDRDYLTLRARLLVDDDVDAYRFKIERLAEHGQINAIQDYYFLKSGGERNSKVDWAFLCKDVESSGYGLATHFELYFTAGLFCKCAKDLPKHIVEVFRSWCDKNADFLIGKSLKNDKRRNNNADYFFGRAIECGKSLSNQYLWSDKYKSGIINERLAEMCKMASKFGDVYERANKLAEEDLLKTFNYKTGDECSTILFANNKERNQPSDSDMKLYIYEYAQRPLSFEENDEAGAE